jgi:peptide deformylase
MQLISKPDHTKKQGIYALSRKATRADITLAGLMAFTMDDCEEQWGKDYGMKAWALAHAQLTESEEPVRIFVVHQELVGTGNKVNARFPARAIFNPVILSAPQEIVTVKPVRKTVFNPNTGKREIHAAVPTEAKTPNMFSPQEGCMSFTHRKPKKINRVFRITVRYWYPRRILGFWVLWRVTESIEGLKSQIFQHELQHMEGENIFHDKV